MNNEQSSSQFEMATRRIENEMLRFIDESWVLLNSGRLKYAGVKALMTTIEVSVKERDEFESTAPAEILSPLYFETSSALDALRAHVVEALKKIEADPDIPKE